MDEGSAERQRRDRDGWSEQRPGPHGWETSGVADAQRRSGGKEDGFFGEMTSQEVGKGGDNEQKGKECVPVCAGRKGGLEGEKRSLERAGRKRNACRRWDISGKISRDVC